MVLDAETSENVDAWATISDLYRILHSVCCDGWVSILSVTLGVGVLADGAMTRGWGEDG